MLNKQYVVCWTKDGIRASRTFQFYEEAVRFSTDYLLNRAEGIHLIQETLP